MSHVIYPHQFFDRNNDNTEEITVSDHSHHIEFNDLTAEEEASKVLIPSREPGLIYTTPRPGLEGLGIQIADKRLGHFTLMLTPDQTRYLVEQLTIGLNNLETMRIETLFRGEHK